MCIRDRRYTQTENGELAIANFRLAVNRKFVRRGDPEADFFSCTAFGRKAEFAEKYLFKGIKKMCIRDSITTISTSPVIFLGSMLFALLTVLLSCSKPGKMAARVSPVEATKYTDAIQTKKKQRSTRGAKLHQMAFANLERNKNCLLYTSRCV